MKTLLRITDRYMKESDISTLAVIKFCLVSFGMLMGMQVPKKAKKPVQVACASIFVASYVPLMAKLVSVGYKEIKGE